MKSKYILKLICLNALLMNFSPVSSQKLYEKFEINKKFGIRQNGGKIIQPAIYDEITVTSNNLSFAKKENEYIIFDDGFKLDYPNIKHIVATKFGLQILQNNKVINLFSRWSLTEATDFNTFSNTKQDLEIIKNANNYVVTDTTITDDKCFNRRYSSTSSTKIERNQQLFEIQFLNGENSFNTNKSIYNFYLSPLYLKAKNKDGKLGIIKVDFLEKSIDPKIVLPLKYDSISFNGYDSPIEFHLNGLVGFFPIQSEATYTKIEKFDDSFARYTRPNGTEGWLCKDGNEFDDE